MKMVKSLLLVSAAGVVAVSGAQAADLPVKAKPVEYVKVCSLYGAGFYYMPGTDICVKWGGYVRWQKSWNPAGSISRGPAFGNYGTRSGSTDIAERTRANITWDTRQQTAYGTLRTYWLAASTPTAPSSRSPGSPSARRRRSSTSTRRRRLPITPARCSRRTPATPGRCWRPTPRSSATAYRPRSRPRTRGGATSISPLPGLRTAVRAPTIWALDVCRTSSATSASIRPGARRRSQRPRMTPAAPTTAQPSGAMASAISTPAANGAGRSAAVCG